VADERRGLAYGLGAYVLWGLFPLYWPLLEPAGAGEILAHRIVWSLVFLAGVLAVQRQWSWLRELAARPGALVRLTLAAALIAVNWGTYIYGVNTERVVETSLGYFINPLVSVALGVLVLGERLRRWQWVALGIGAVAVVVLTADYGRPPWIALVLACSFGVYGLLKKTVGVPAVQGLAVESAVLVLPALAFVVLQQVGTAAVVDVAGPAAFGSAGAGHALLLAGSGVATAVPLLLFAGAANRIPLSTIGVLQYLAPTLQFAIGVLLYGEPMPAARLAGFALVWVALVVFTLDGVAHHRRAGRDARRGAAPDLLRSPARPSAATRTP